ncbi:MAG: hypothetical protein C0474_12325 [Sphingobium sp.]|nr:hypothetical protein [Sphingobium sp.]
MPSPLNITAPLAAALALAACTARQAATGVVADGPGFWLGLWHGFIFPVAWVASIFVPDIAVYAVPNNGGWYDFGYFLGIVVFGVGARRTQKVYVERVIDRPARRGTVIENEP